MYQCLQCLSQTLPLTTSVLGYAVVLKAHIPFSLETSSGIGFEDIWHPFEPTVLTMPLDTSLLEDFHFRYLQTAHRQTQCMPGFEQATTRASSSLPDAASPVRVVWGLCFRRRRRGGLRPGARARAPAHWRGRGKVERERGRQWGWEGGGDRARTAISPLLGKAIRANRGRP